jgi:hypothetical protein
VVNQLDRAASCLGNSGPLTRYRRDLRVNVLLDAMAGHKRIDLQDIDSVRGNLCPDRLDDRDCYIDAVATFRGDYDIGLPARIDEQPILCVFGPDAMI